MKTFLKKILLLSIVSLSFLSYASISSKNTKDAKSQIYVASVTQDDFYIESEEYEDKWQILSFFSSDKSFKIYEDYPGEKDVENFNQILNFKNEKYFVLKLEPNQTISLNYLWGIYSKKQESESLPEGAQKQDFKLNIKSDDNIIVYEKNSGLDIFSKNSEPVEVYVGLEHGFDDINIVVGNIKKRIEYVENQKRYLFTKNPKEDMILEDVFILLTFTMIVFMIYLSLILGIKHIRDKKEKKTRKEIELPSHLSKW